MAPRSCSFVAIASMQRSGSTEFASQVTQALSGINVGEFFTKGLHEPPAWCGYKPQGAAEDWRANSEFYARLRAPQPSLRRARSACCSRANMSKFRVAGTCILVYRLFNFNLWRTDGMAKAKEFRPFSNATIVLLRDPSTCVVVLERPPEDRYCSWAHAQETGDWSTKPSATHSHAPCRNSTHDQARRSRFMADHVAWYRHLRREALAGVPHLDLTFRLVTSELKRALSRVRSLVGCRCVEDRDTGGVPAELFS